MEKLKIIKCEAKEGAQHVRVYTDKGWYSAFDDAKAMCLQSIDKYLNCEIRETESKGRQYKNIISAEMCDDEVRVEFVKPSEAFATKKESTWGLREYEKCPVGLSVEIFIASINDAIKNGVIVNSDNVVKLMGQSIALVKQARKEF